MTMTWTKIRLMSAAALFSLAMLPSLAKSETVKALDEKELARMEESAETPADWRELANLWEARAEHMTEKAARHERLEQRYAAAPKSLIAKRAHGWNTPQRQAELAAKAREEAAEARQAAATLIARADADSTAVD